MKGQSQEIENTIGSDDNSGNLNLYFYNLVQTQLGIVNVAVSGTEGCQQNENGKILKKLR